MSLTASLLPLVAIAAFIGVTLLVLKTMIRRAGSGDKFNSKSLLTANELEFLMRLESAVPELRFCPQVAMGALLEPAVSRDDSKTYYRLGGMFAQKIVDFVAQERASGLVVAIIELDDRTHDAAKDAKRDAMLHSAGYHVIRWPSKNKPNIAAIRTALQTAGAPIATNRVASMAAAQSKIVLRSA